MPVSEYMKYVKSEIIVKHGFDRLTKFEADTRYIGEALTGYSANPKQAEKYVFLLNFDEQTDSYFVSCNGYGVREISADGTGVWNPDTEEFEPFFVVNEN